MDFNFALVFVFCSSLVVDADVAGERRSGTGGSLVAVGLFPTEHGAYGATLPRRGRGDGKNRLFITRPFKTAVPMSRQNTWK